MASSPLTVAIVGAGFGGLSAAKVLANRPGIRVFLFDRRNYHLFQPLLYQVATAGLSPADIAVPIRGEFSRADNVEVHLGEVAQIDLGGKRLLLKGAETSSGFTYDRLILACGSKHSYFGKPEWEEFAPGLKTLEQATEIRRRVLTAFEAAENDPDPEIQREHLTFVVVGGGPTGVELAGALAEISRKILVRDFRRIDPASTRVILMEAGPRILAMFAESLSARAARDLHELGVEVRTGSRVTGMDARGVSIGAERIAARTLIWAAGVQPSSLGKRLGVPLDSLGRVIVSSDLSLPGHPDVYVVGDQARCEDRPGSALPGLAPVAIQQGRWAARNILRGRDGSASLPFHYLDKGQMATIGKIRAVCEYRGLKFGGWMAWMAWLSIHLYFLVGFRNRLAVMSEWAWNYVFSKRTARLIVGKDWRSY